MTAKVLTLFPWPQLSADNFEAFWKFYPRRVAKIDAQRVWARLTPQERIDALRAIPRHAEQWRRQDRHKQMIPHATTWLNGRRWEDELDESEDLGQCVWNRPGRSGEPGARDPNAPQCAERANYTDPKNGNVYCPRHAATLGLIRRKA